MELLAGALDALGAIAVMFMGVGFVSAFTLWAVSILEELPDRDADEHGGDEPDSGPS
jgi:hypothetical protein